MSTVLNVNEAHSLPHSMEKMNVNTPCSSKTSRKCDMEASCLSTEEDSLVPLSPPLTIDVRQKRERSESLMQYHLNESLVTKRRLRSRSRIGLEADEMASSIMTPPCSSKPRERTRSIRSQLQEPNENLHYYPKTLEQQRLPIHTSSVFITPCSEETQTRKPLINRDLNATNETSFWRYAVPRFESEILSAQSDSSSDTDSETTSTFEDKTRTKLIFEDAGRKRWPALDSNVTTSYSLGKIIGQRIGLNRLDFIKELVDLNCEEICKKIFCYLEPQNLQRVASVSLLWRRICKKDRVASPRLDQFIHGRKQYVLRKGKENLGSEAIFGQRVPHRQPFSDLKSNTILTTNEKRPGNEGEQDEIKPDIMSTCEKIKCPFCGSPSQKVGKQICECDKCQETFCSSCKHRMDKFHKDKCGIKPNKSKKGKAKEVIGSKRSKSRLKRF